MKTFGHRIRPYVDHELLAARCREEHGDAVAAFGHLERAHVLGQASTVQHVRVHWRMLRWAFRQGAWRECVGQVIRVTGAATKTFVGLVPPGNTGGSNISPFKRLPIAPDLADSIKRARRS
jgi:hypothetical protein